MTDKDKKFERIAQRHIADLKKSSRSMVEDAAVRAVHKVMAEFAQGAHTEAKVEYHSKMIQCPQCDGPVRVPAQPYPDNFIDALKYDVAKRDSEAQPEQEPVAWMQEMPTKGDETRSVRLTTVEALAREEWANPIPLYTTPPRREWVGLTDEEVVDLKMLGRDLEFVSMTALRRFARDIEQTLKEKNA